MLVEAAPVEASADTSRVCMDLEPGERVMFTGTGVEIEVMSKSGRHARLRVISPRDVIIKRVTQENSARGR